MDIPECGDNEYKEVAWAIPKFGAKFEPVWINRPKVGEMDVKFKMEFCGICHSDCHLGLNHLGGSMYPMVPGHELCGTVIEVGSGVTKVKVGDKCGVGCIIDSCLDCGTCKGGDEQYCEKGGSTHTYNSLKNHGHIGGNQETQNFGGYSGSNVVHEHFIIKIPDDMPLEKAGPIMCAGITMYDPLRHWGATKEGGPKMCIGIVGVGGLGTMGIKMAHALGHRVVAISTSAGKEELAKGKGADAFVVSTDGASMAKEAGKLDLIINTVSAAHEVSHYLSLLKTNGTIVQLGLVPQPHSVCQLPLIFGRKSVSGSLIGGIPATEECLAFCAKHNITPDTQLVEASEIDWAWDQLTTVNKDGIRYVIDIQKSLGSAFVPK